MKYDSMLNVAASILLIGAATIAKADLIDYMGCKATVDLKSFDDRIRVTHQAGAGMAVVGGNLELVIVDQDGIKVGDALVITLQINQTLTLSVKDVFSQANAPKPWKLNNKFIQVIEQDGNIEHDMQGTVSYANGVAPLVFTCVTKRI